MSQDLEPPEKRRRVEQGLSSSRIPASNQNVAVDHDHGASDKSSESLQKSGFSADNLQTELAAPSSSANEDVHVEPDLITINIQSLSGMLPPIAISAAATVRDFKLCIQTLNTDVVFDRQKLLISEPDNEGAGVLLLNHLTLQSYHITGSTNLVLVVLPKPGIEVCIDDYLKDSVQFAALLGDQDLRSTSINVGSITRYLSLLLQLFEANRAVQSIKICGCWTDEHLCFCRSLLALRPDIDIRYVVNGRNQFKMMLLVLEFCKLNRCLSFQCSEVHLGRFSPGCGSLASILQSMSSLHILILSSNKIDDRGCAALAPALQTMSSLQTLNLDKNDIGASGCAALASALQSMPSLQTLVLSNNDIGDEGCFALINALQSMPSLEKLDLGYNHIGPSGCSALINAQQSMTALHTLKLTHNDMY